MYIDHVNRRPSIREANRIETVQAKNVNIKKLKMLDKQAAKAFNSAKYHGGRLFLAKGFGSWFKNSFNKLRNYTKTAFNKVIKPAYQKVIKPGLDYLTKNEAGKKILSGVSSVIGSAVSAIPVVGPIAGPVVSNTLPSVLNSVDDIATAGEKIVQSIKDKNPQITVQQAKDIYNTIKNTYNTLNDEAKKAKAEQMKTIEKNLPETIKAEGFEAVMKAAPFLPIVDLSTLKEEQQAGKGGRIKTVYKIRKPAGADKLGKYSAPIVARVSGRLFLGGRVYDAGYLRAGECSEDKTKTLNTSVDSIVKPTQSTKSEVKTNKNMDLLQQLRKKYTA